MGAFRLLALVNNAAKSTGKQTSLHNPVFNSFDYVTRSGTTGPLKGRLLHLKLLVNAQPCFPKSWSVRQGINTPETVCFRASRSSVVERWPCLHSSHFTSPSWSHSLAKFSFFSMTCAWIQDFSRSLPTWLLLLVLQLYQTLAVTETRPG